MANKKGDDGDDEPSPGQVTGGVGSPMGTQPGSAEGRPADAWESTRDIYDAQLFGFQTKEPLKAGINLLETGLIPTSPSPVDTMMNSHSSRLAG